MGAYLTVQSQTGRVRPKRSGQRRRHDPRFTRRAPYLRALLVTLAEFLVTSTAFVFVALIERVARLAAASTSTILVSSTNYARFAFRLTTLSGGSAVSADVSIWRREMRSISFATACSASRRAGRPS
jgi:hypothetical protein